MNVLIIGSGGREHALAWKVSQSNSSKNIYIAPGNAGTAAVGKNLDIGVNDFPAIAQALLEFDVSMLIIGPEDPLVNGLRDYLQDKPEFSNLLIIGPDAAGAQLEGSKDFSKIFMEQYGIPTATFKTFTSENIESAFNFIEEQSTPIVVKADGLAAGKGVIIAQSTQEAKDAVKSMLIDKKFAEAGQKILIEDFLDGIELSVFVLTDGKNYKVLPEAKDYKRIGEQDSGLNTGGMGAVSPVSFASKDFLAKVETQVIKPTLAGLSDQGIKYIGFLFIGLMNVEGEPYVIEYNVRMGDPETQVVLPRIDTDFLELLTAAAIGNLDTIGLKISNDTATTVVGVAGGYPEKYEKNHVINGLDQSLDATVFHAGTKVENSQTLTNGGRVIAVTGRAKNLSLALQKSYSAMAKINWQDIYYRKDIGQDLLNIE
jgi:phosphoribosylamine---glycine ligase